MEKKDFFIQVRHDLKILLINVNYLNNICPVPLACFLPSLSSTIYSNYEIYISRIDPNHLTSISKWEEVRSIQKAIYP